MSKEDLKLYIKNRADEEIRKIVEEAENTAKKIVEEAENTAKKTKDERLRKSEKEIDEKERAVISIAKMEGKKSVMNVKKEFLEKSLSEVEKRLKSLSSSQNAKYQEILVNLTLEAALNITSKDMKVSANKGDLGVLRGIIQTIESDLSKMKGSEVGLEIDDKAIDAIGGVIVYSKDGKQIFNNTLEARLDRSFEAIKGKITHMLFEG